MCLPACRAQGDLANVHRNLVHRAVFRLHPQFLRQLVQFCGIFQPVIPGPAFRRRKEYLCYGSPVIAVRTDARGNRPQKVPRHDGVNVGPANA